MRLNEFREEVWATQYSSLVDEASRSSSCYEMKSARTLLKRAAAVREEAARAGKGWCIPLKDIEREEETIRELDEFEVEYAPPPGLIRKEGVAGCGDSGCRMCYEVAS